MDIYRLKLHKTYFNNGYFNIPVDFDRLVRAKEGDIEINVGGKSIEGKVNRSANQNVHIPTHGGHRIRRMLDTDSGAWWTLIPTHAGHRFRTMVDTSSSDMIA